MEVNIILDLLSLIILTVLFFNRSRFGQKTQAEYHLFILMMSIIADILSVDCVSWILDGKIYCGSRVLLSLLNTLYWFGQIAFCWLWLIYIFIALIKTNYSINRVLVSTSIPLIVEVILLLVNAKTGIIFNVDASCHYIRGNFYTYNLVLYFIYIVAALGTSIFGALRCKDYYQKKINANMITYLILPVMGTIIQSINYSYSLIWPFTALSMFMFYVSKQQERISEEQILATVEKEKRTKLEKELLDNRINIMMSQIQPHFLYNSLTVISELCDIDPKKAKETTIDFSKYLRANLDSLKETRPLPFENELKHVRTYLNLEKVRFEDDLNIVYDIQTTSFLFPTLALQPIVENAVKYGVCQKEDGGTVWISTYEEDDYIYIVVKDDGIGFDMTKQKNDGRSHIGITNVRNRIENMCNGTLEITSEVNVGTVATIKIPKSSQ